MSPSPIAIIERSGRYEVRRKLGEGTNGTVYQVHDRQHDTDIALKVLRRAKPGQIYRFKNEFRQLADLSHPNLAALHELTCESNVWFFTMELVEGISFPDYVRPGAASSTLDEAQSTIQDDVRCDLERLRDALGQLVAGVSTLHAAGKLHLDLKPSNVLITPSGRVVVLDFGLVRDWQEDEPEQWAEQGKIRGTPAYMSPEQALGESVGPASDWYSVGVMLYEVLCGRLPFVGTIHEVLGDKVLRDAPPAASMGRGIPSDLESLCDALLQRDTSARPDERAILRSSTHTQRPTRAAFVHSLFPGASRKPLPLVGRGQELAALSEASNATGDSHPVVTLIHGSSGMGKTALVQHFLRVAEENPSTLVLQGRCFEREFVPYKAFDGVLDAVASYLASLPDEEAASFIPRDIRSLARLFPVLKRANVVTRWRQRAPEETDPRMLRARAFTALKDLLGRMADAHTLIVHIDDLHWGDVDSARLLLDLLSPPDPPGMLFIGTYRDEDRTTSAFLSLLLEHDMYGKGRLDARGVPLGPLTPEASVEMARSLLRSLVREAPSLPAIIAHESEGVPFFITELARHERLRQSADDARRPSLSLHQVVLERRESLSPAARRLLDALSVAGQPLEQGVALQAAELAAGSSEPLLELRSARLIRTRGTRPADAAETYHDRVRQAVVEHMDDDQRRMHHRLLASSLRSWGISDPERLFTHYLGAGERERAGECALEAARAAADKLAFNRAVEMYRSAVELLPPCRSAPLHAELGDALANAGRGAEAAQSYLQAAEHAALPYAQRLRRQAASQLLRSGRIREGIELSKQVLHEVGLRYPESTLEATAHIFKTRAIMGLRGLPKPEPPQNQPPTQLLAQLEACGSVFRELGAVEPLHGAALQSLHLRLALRAGEPNAILKGLAGYALSTAQVGGPKAEQNVERILDVVAQMAAHIATAEARAASLATRAVCSAYLCDFANVVAPAREAEDIYRTQCPHGTWWERNNNVAVLYLGLQVTGDLPAMAREAPRWVLAARERDDRFSITMLFLTECIHRLAIDDTQGAIALIEEQRRVLGHGRYHMLHCTMMCRTLDNHLYLGAGRRALDHLQEQWPHYAASFVSRAQLPRTVVEYHRGRCALAAGAEQGYQDKLLSMARDSARRLARESTTYARLCGRLIDAGVACAEGDLDSSLVYLDEAAKGFDAIELPLYAASARRRLGEILDNDTGRDLIACADRLLRAKGIVRPDRWSAIWVPRLHGNSHTFTLLRAA